MGKKSSKETQTTTSQPPAWAVPIIQGGSQAVMDNYTANQGNLQALQSNLTGSVLPGLQAQIGQTSQQLQPGYDYIGSTLANNPGLANPSNSFLSSTLGGSYLNANPYTQALADQAGQAAGNAVNSTFSLAGRTGSGNHATDLARGVDQAENGVFFQNYQNERGLQNQAAGLLGQNYNTGLGIQANAAGMLPGYTSAQYAGYTPLLAGTQLAGQLPYYGSNSLGTIGSLLGGYGTSSTTGTKPGGWGTDILGAAMTALPFVL